MEKKKQTKSKFDLFIEDLVKAGIDFYYHDRGNALTLFLSDDTYSIELYRDGKYELE